jgi:hypothetical protein
MPFEFSRARPLLQNGDLAKLFVEELGWEPKRQKLTLRASERDFAFSAIAEKRGFTVWVCETPDNQLPDHTTRLKLDRALTQTSFEHLIVFASGDRSRQSWMWVRREPNKPLSPRTHEFIRSQPGDSLLQKLQILYVSLEEEEKGELSTIAMAGRARAAFDIERVTKAFYRDFDTHRKAFLKFIDGIGEVADREWYASVMLNRLMFVYFIQRKGFLDADPEYLRNRLQRCQQEKGKDKFYTFYRYFLLRLFHEGFGKRRKDRAPDLEKLLGNIPYLNGGLFDVHLLEKPECYGKTIQIPDKAFERVFDYFDQYQWHLDERPLRKDDEINPDVLGYIFEKYINQKQMGAYYTKEDITEYISKNTVLPFLFDAARAKCKVAFENADGPTVWDLLRENPDRFIYSAMRHGTDKTIPSEIAVGLDTTKPNLIERRKTWNKPAPADYALPTEIWREVVARRQRYEEVRKKLAAGEVKEVNDFITLNLDLRQFAQDAIQNSEGPDLLMAFWQAITTITVLDPTGGSGAFIFAALNILEPLYEACLDRMEGFVAEWGTNGRKAHPNYHKKFSEVLARVDAHPNRRYFVLKSIILNNLYAVDIMEEAVEICKLRLFLKLAAQVEPDAARDNLGIEPLPDIDFNIRAGNTLVGYATYDEVKHAVTSTLDFDNAMETIAVKAADLQQTFDKFRQLQTEGDGSVPVADKQELQKRLKALEDELNRHLAGEYGVKVSDKAAYAKWLKSHQPFHWFIQFYGILNSGGFDVIIGNPPYVELSKIRDYVIQNLKTTVCGNLYCPMLERFAALGAGGFRLGVIVPLSLSCTERMNELREVLVSRFGETWVSHFSGDAHPSKLFEGVKLRLDILLGVGGSQFSLWSSQYLKWFAAGRPALFTSITYTKAPANLWYLNLFPKLGSELGQSVMGKLLRQAPLGRFTSLTGKTIYVHRVITMFVKCFDFVPYFRNETDGVKKSEDYKPYQFTPAERAEAAVAVLNSSTFFFYFVVLGDCFHCGKEFVLQFPFDLAGAMKNSGKQLAETAKRLIRDLKRNAIRKTAVSEMTGAVEYDEFWPSKSKPILDEIDRVLAEHYGFTAEELDFILNYDIKYRMGRDAGEED